MDSFEDIVNHCKANSRFYPLIDKFLIYYAARTDRLERKMDQQLKRYKHIAKKLPSREINILKSEYIASQIFRKNGLIGKYLKHSAIKALAPDEYNFLKFQHQYPWRLSFARIIDQPAEHFFQMLDLFTGEEYLLYSPGMSASLVEEPVYSWLNLISFNGKCWETFGLILSFNGFTADDFFFFATELHPELEDEEDLVRAVETNPWPFFMLISRGTVPFMQGQGVRLVYHYALDELSAFPNDQLNDAFQKRWKDEIFELSLEPWSKEPHFAKAYYNETAKTLVRFAFTEIGFTQLTAALLEQGIELDPDPEIIVSPGMLLTTEEILRRKIELNPYEELFIDHEAEENQEIKKLNHLLDLAMPLINNDETLDIEKLAAEAGVETKVAKDLLEKMQERIRKRRDRK